MARNIGRVEVTVDANTGRLVAQSRISGHRAGSAWGSAFEDEIGDIQGREFLARIRVLRARAEAALRDIEIDVGVDDAGARAGLKALEAKLRATELELSIEPDVDNSRFQRELAALRAMIRDIRVDMDVDIDPAEIVALRQLIDQLMGDIVVDVEPRYDPSVWLRMRRRIGRWASDTGEEADEKFWQGFNFEGDDTKLALAAIAAFGDAITQGLAGATSAATAIIASAFQGIVGGIGAATPIIAGFGAAATAAAVGGQGFGEALGLIDEEFENAREEGRKFNTYAPNILSALGNLSPNARDAALAFGGLKDELNNSRRAVQESLFEGLDQTLVGLADETLPDITGALVIAAGSVNEFVRQLAAVADNIAWTDSMIALDPALDNIFDASTTAIDTLAAFLVIAAPAAEELAGWLESGALNLQKWVISNDDDIREFLEDGVVSLRHWGALIASISGLFATIFASGSGTGDAFVVDLNNLIETWDAWLTGPKGQTALDEFFGKGKTFLEDIDPVIQGIQDAVGILVGEGNFAGLMQDLGEALPPIAELIAAIGDLDLGGAFLDILEVLGPLFDLFNSLPEPLTAALGAFLLLQRAVTGLNGALKGLALSNGAVLAVAGALTAGLLIFDAFSGGEDEATQRTDELSRALRNNLDTIVRQSDGLNSARVGLDAFNQTLTEGDEGEKLVTNLGRLGKTAQDTRDVLLSMAQDNVGTLTDLANSADDASTAFDLTGGQAELLAQIVAGTNDNFDNLGDSLLDAYDNSGAVRDALGDLGIGFDDIRESGGKGLAEALGLSEEALRLLLSSMENVEDQTDENRDVLQDMAAAELEAALGSSELSRQLVQDAADNLGYSGSLDEIIANGDNLIPLFDEYAQLLNETSNAANDGTDAHDLLTDGMVAAGLATYQAAEAAKAEADALRESRAAAYDAYQAELDLAEATREAAFAAASADFGIPVEISEQLFGMAENFRAATEAADAFNSAMEVILGGSPDYEEAISNTAQALNDIRAAAEGAEEGAEALDPALATLREAGGQIISVFDLTTESGQEASQMMRDAAAAALEQAAAGVLAGDSAEQLNANLDATRQTLEDQLVAWGVNETAAEEYVNTILGTPELVETIINNPGLIDAIMNAEDLTVLYDDMGNPVITEFEALGLDPAIASSEDFVALLEALTGEDYEVAVEADVQGAADDVSGLQQQATDLGETDPEIDPTLDPIQTKRELDVLFARLGELNLYIVDIKVNFSKYAKRKQDLDTLIDLVDDLDDASADPSIDLPDYRRVSFELGQLDGKIDALDAESASISITVPGIWDRIAEVNALDRAIDNISNRTVSVVTNYSSSGRPGGAMAGALIDGPQTINVGERGLAEAIVPLELPLNQVDPSVRWMAELIRGEGKGGVNVTQHITPLAADPVAVSQQVVNRIAELVG